MFESLLIDIIFVAFSFSMAILSERYLQSSASGPEVRPLPAPEKNDQKSAA